MKANSMIFIIGFVLAFAGGYLFFDSSNAAEETADPAPAEDNTASQKESSEDTADDGESEASKQESSAETETASVPAEAEPLNRNNCLSCHAVESLGAQGGTTGPDLSNAYNEVENKHGKPLNEFLQEPTSAVMSTVIGDNPLPDKEREAIIETLKKAAEKGGQS
ncbi:cytochrome C [Virgibacillus sp. MSP4-1]|uniref:hypothetical protein n=1 Tax=Virgibacillus sp. MSP4-1 TaxID=2700081 RepID=UPI0003A0A0E6|nr:hypothetical protein [Virgibacillus sp. MSP4-1]QHS24172.1 cytochrome C [Virgibacillus sp. MSP4-1]